MKLLKFNPLRSSWPEDIKLNGDEVHVWLASLAVSDRCSSQLAQTLTGDEDLKAKGFRFERDRRNFVASRGILRSILGQYLDENPNKLKFCYGRYGKPYLSTEFDQANIRFNIAHSHELAIYAFTCSREIGIDLEYARPIPDTEQIASRFFSDQEKAAWFALPAELRQEAFYVYWTRTEAYIKALGGGLLPPLREFDISSLPDGSTLISRCQTGNTKWFFRSIIPEPGYIATLALEGTNYGLSFYRWTHTTPDHPYFAPQRFQHLIDY